MNHPLRENLEIFTDGDGTWIRCTRCLHILCPSEKDWRDVCKINHSEPTKAGPLMTELVGLFLLQQLYCPSCGALMDTDLVETEQCGEKGKAL